MNRNLGESKPDSRLLHCFERFASDVQEMASQDPAGECECVKRAVADFVHRLGQLAEEDRDFDRRAITRMDGEGPNPRRRE